MSDDRTFVGRKDELRRFQSEVLERTDGQAVVVIGASAMGKTWLVDEMASNAANHPTLKSGHVRYECTPLDSPGSVMSSMMDQAYECAGVVEKSFDATPTRLKQWKAFLDVLKVGDLVMSLRRDPQRPTREQFVKALERISKRMQDDQRAIFVVDPEKYMFDGSADEWRIVVRDLPAKIKFIFAQCPDDQLASRQYGFLDLPNVVVIPDNALDVLDESAVEELIKTRWSDLPKSCFNSEPRTSVRADDPYSTTLPKAGEQPPAARSDIQKLRDALARYHGHPYAVNAALGLLVDGVAFDDLPNEPKPTTFAHAQWRRACDEHDETAIRLLTAYAILEVPVPDDVVEPVAQVSPEMRRKFLANPFLSSLLRKEQDDRRIYHVLLAEMILADATKAEANGYHQRAIDVYRERIKEDVKPDQLACERLPAHVLIVLGPEAFVEAFVNECGRQLLELGALDSFFALNEQAMRLNKDQLWLARLCDNRGLACRLRGQLNEAEQLHNRARKIYVGLGRREETAGACANLGAVYFMRGELDRAEEAYRSALNRNKELGRIDATGDNYHELGNVFIQRGDLDQAERMFSKALDLYREFGRLGAMGDIFCNLGHVYTQRNYLDRAEEMLNKSVEINTTLGRSQSVASAYGNLGTVYVRQGDLDRGEQMFNKSLEIDTKRGNLDGVARAYSKLGIVHGIRGNLKAARESGTKACDLFQQLGARHMVEKIQEWLDGLS